MPTYAHGRHEHGQNFLTDRATLAAMTRLVGATTGLIVEIGAGDGALTVHLARLGRPLTAIEIDPDMGAALAARVGPDVDVVTGDFFAHRLPHGAHVLVGNLPFHLTTAILRRILRAPGWTDAVLLTQWEVARRRAGVGRTTMMTVQWAPWFRFELAGRVPARAFTPRPGVDGGILIVRRRSEPRLPTDARRDFQALVHRVFTGRGRGLARILARTTRLGTVPAATVWLARHGLQPSALPGDLGTDARIELFGLSGRGRVR